MIRKRSTGLERPRVGGIEVESSGDDERGKNLGREKKSLVVVVVKGLNAKSLSTAHQFRFNKPRLLAYGLMGSWASWASWAVAYGRISGGHGTRATRAKGRMA